MKSQDDLDVGVNAQVELDAREFGIHAKQGGWRLGLLVARNVNNSGKRGVVSKANDSHESLGKLTIREFAEKAGTSPERVRKYLMAWNTAAEDDVVPNSRGLHPGQEVDLDVDALPDWSEYYPPPSSPKPNPDPTPMEQARKLAAETDLSYRRIGPMVGIDESVIRRDLEVRAIRGDRPNSIATNCGVDNTWYDAIAIVKRFLDSLFREDLTDSKREELLKLLNPYMTKLRS